MSDDDEIRQVTEAATEIFAEALEMAKAEIVGRLDRSPDMTLALGQALALALDKGLLDEVRQHTNKSSDSTLHPTVNDDEVTADVREAASLATKILRQAYEAAAEKISDLDGEHHNEVWEIALLDGSVLEHINDLKDSGLLKLQLP